MASVLQKLKRPEDPRLLVGINTADDAGVFLVEPGMALVQTVDMLTPMVEDPYLFGRIAATNSLSDVYAMGGEPLVVLNIVGFPAPAPKDWLAAILQGGQDTCNAAGAAVAGGHTFNEKEIKYGLAVTGRIDPDRIVTNAGARPGDALVLTKPLGAGMFGQALMTLDSVDPVLHAAATGSMTTLNREAARAMLECGAHAATDITGYGLLGHAQEMAAGSGVGMELAFGSIPLLPGVLELSRSNLVEPGVAMNEAGFGQWVTFDTGLGEAERNLLFESETSGGLLVVLAPALVERFIELAGDRPIVPRVVGTVTDEPAGTLRVRM